MVPQSIFIIFAALQVVTSWTTLIEKYKYKYSFHSTYYPEICTSTIIEVDLSTSTTLTTRVTTSTSTSVTETTSTTVTTSTDVKTSTTVLTSTTITTSATCSSTCAARQTPTALLQNGDFPDPLGTTDPWMSFVTSGSPAILSVDDTVFNTGDASLRYTKEPSYSPFQFVRQQLDPNCLIADRAYQFSAFVRFQQVYTSSGEGCGSGQAVCTYGPISSPAGEGNLVAAADALNNFVQTSATCVWTQAELDQGNIQLAMSFDCSGSVAWMDTATFGFA